MIGEIIWDGLGICYRPKSENMPRRVERPGHVRRVRADIVRRYHIAWRSQYILCIGHGVWGLIRSCMYT